MKFNILKTTALILSATAIFSACTKPGEEPVPVEEELITTVQLLVTNSAGFNKTFSYKVENGFGTTSPGSTTIDTVALEANKQYDVEIKLLNEKESPAENITEEVIAESNDHLFFFQSTPVSGNGSIVAGGGNKDAAGNPFNQKVKFTTADAGKGLLVVTLKHQPTNKSATDPRVAGGETDAEVTFPVRLQ